MSTHVLTVSSKGQVVLPARLRKRLSIGSGDHPAVYTSGDVIMLERIDMPPEDDFRSRLDETRSRLNKSEMEPERLPCGELLTADGKAIVLEGGVSLPVTTSGQPGHGGSNRSPLSAAS